MTQAGFAEAGRLLGALGLPTVVVQEGGYDLATIGGLVRAALAGLEEGSAVPEPLALWVGKEEYGGVPTPTRRGDPKPPHWRLEAVAATERPRTPSISRRRATSSPSSRIATPRTSGCSTSGPAFAGA